MQKFFAFRTAVERSYILCAIHARVVDAHFSGSRWLWALAGDRPRGRGLVPSLRYLQTGQLSMENLIWRSRVAPDTYQYITDLRRLLTHGFTSTTL